MCAYTQTHTHTLTHKHTYGTCGSLWHVKCIVCACVCVCVCVCVSVWKRRLGCLIFTGHFPRTRPTNSGWFAEGLTLTRKIGHSFTHTVTHYNILQHTATLCNTLQRPVWRTNTHQTEGILWVSTLQHTATYCNTLQHSATLCNTLGKRTHTHTEQKASYGPLPLCKIKLLTQDVTCAKKLQIEICKYPQKRLTYLCRC